MSARDLRLSIPRERATTWNERCFADSVRVALNSARNEAARLRHEYCGTEKLNTCFWACSLKQRASLDNC